MRTWLGQGVAVVTVDEPIDPANEQVLRDHLCDAITATPRLLVVDLRDATLFGSSGVNALVDAWTRIDQRFPLLLTSPRLLAARVLEITGVLQLPRVALFTPPASEHGLQTPASGAPLEVENEATSTTTTVLHGESI